MIFFKIEASKNYFSYPYYFFIVDANEQDLEVSRTA
jgi:hypothetical protein